MGNPGWCPVIHGEGSQRLGRFWRSVVGVFGVCAQEFVHRTSLRV